MPFTPPIATPDVKAIAVLESDDLSVHISNTEIFMDTVFAGETLSDSIYRLIGLYLTAHFAFVQEGQIKTEKLDVLSTTFNMVSDLALSSTVHGQQALALDPTGTLAELNAQAKQDPADGPKIKARIDIV